MLYEVTGDILLTKSQGIAHGIAPNDPSVMRAEFNNIVGNDRGVDATSASQGILAPNNWWGANGPFHPTTNATGQGNLVTDKVTFIPFLGTKTPVVTATSTDQYRTLTTTTGVAISPLPGQPNPVTTGPVRFTVTVSDPPLWWML